MTDKTSRNIPKFASFNLKPVSSSLGHGTLKSDDAAESRNQHIKWDEKKEKRHHHGKHSRHRSRSKEKPPARVAEAAPPQQKYEPSELFVVDRKGDVKNIEYGSIHRYSVPPFRRYGAGYVLGASTDVRIDRNHEDGKTIIFKNSKNIKLNSREKYMFSRIEREKPRLLKIRPESLIESQSNDADYVPLQSSRERKRKRHGTQANDLSDSSADERDYRSIYGKKRVIDQPQDPDLQFATESDSSGSDAGRRIKFDASIRKKNIELSRRVENFPLDVDAWLELINYQDVLIREGDNNRRITNAEVRSTADIKIHMYEKALEKIEALGDRESLLLGLMSEGSKIWELKVQSDRWEHISKDNIDSLLLWTSYLNFKMSTLQTFRYEDVKEIFIQRLKLLLKTCSCSGGQCSDNIYQQIIYVVLRFTLFVRESGYAELALATWQGFLELNFFAPTDTLTQETCGEMFKDFWESECARIGEDGALGWSYFEKNRDSTLVPDGLNDETNGSLNISEVFTTWTLAEVKRSRISRLPARTMDEVAEDDPYRVILFSDIEDLLILLPASKTVERLCIDGFLLFCRLPALPSDDFDTSRKWSLDPFIANHFLEIRDKWIQQDFFSAIEGENDIGRKDIALQLPFSNIAPSPRSRFGSQSQLQMKRWKEIYGGDNGPVPFTWMRNTLKQLTYAHFREDLAEYYLAFEYMNEPDNIKKVAKSILKQHPSSLPLYNAYAMIEWSRGNKDAASGVFSAALSLNHSKLETENDSRSINLWQNWVWCLIEDLNNSSALQTLLCIPDGIPNATATLSPVAIMRSRQHLASNRDFQISSGNSGLAVVYSECLALLEYLAPEPTKETISVSQGSIDAALEIFRSFSIVLDEKRQKISHELCLQSAARLLVHHIQHGPFRPALIRDQLAEFLKFFPQNTTFLSLYAWNESRLRVDNRVRNILLSNILIASNDTLTSRLFAIYHEIQHGTIHSVKAAFENALAVPASKYSPGLWKLYFLYTLQTPQFRPKASEIWFRALRACPWAKDLYLLGFKHLNDSMPFAELKSAWRVLGEKELRVHVDLEDRFDEIKEVEDRKIKKRRIDYRQD